MLAPGPPRRQPRSHEEQRGSETSDPVVPVVRLKVTLLEFVPPVWRRLRVPANLTLRRLHAVLQTAMGWKKSPLHLFRVGDELFGMPAGDAERVKDSRWTTLQHLLSLTTKTFSYEYQLGERWAHLVKIEGVLDGDRTNQSPLCLAGERPCPPAGCGGPDAYVDTLAATQDREAVDLDAVNEALAALKL
jgi:hypothetical protein